MRALVIAVLLALPAAAAPLAVPEEIPPLPQGQATCNQALTHCLVNFKDLRELHDRAVRAEAELEAERASKRKVCATVQRTASWRP